MKSKRLIIPALALAFALPMGAVRAIDKFIEVRQPDGTIVSVKKCGDEFSHYLVSTDGALLAEENGAYYFAKVANNGLLQSTGILAADPEKRNATQKSAVTLLNSEIAKDLSAARNISPRKAVDQSGMGRFTSNFPRTGDIKGLVILVSYTDVGFQVSDPYAYFNGLLNVDGFSDYNATGCAAEYFRSNSNNQFRPVFDVLGPVQLPQPRSYYGGNDYMGNDKNPEDMVVHSIQILDEQGVDFSQYDMDGDGTVDNVFIIYAGQGEASYGPAASVWPHSWQLQYAGKSFKVDGVTINTYGCSNEWEMNRPDGVGTFIHEFSHVMGLPDLYCTDYSNPYATPGRWSVLDYGPYNNDGCTPPNYSAYERLAMGWIDPEVLDGPNSITLTNLDDDNQACIIQTPKTTEYYLLENRQKTGWDTYLPGHGMLIWHVDFVQSVFDANKVNNQKNHMYVELKKASGVVDATTDAILAGWSWPGTYRKTEFTDDTNPSMKTWTGKALGLPITGIKEENGLIKFDIAGGKSLLDAPEAMVPVNYGYDWFEAVWEPVENATDYLLTVIESKGGFEGAEYVNNMGSGTSLSMPEGWTSSGTAVYSTNSNFGEASPSYKMSTDEAYLKSPVFDCDVTSISFWNKGMQAVGSRIVVTGLDETGIKVYEASVEPNKSSAKTDVLNEIPFGVRQVVLTYRKESGNVAIDDVVIVTGGTRTGILEGFNRLSTEGATSYTVNHDVIEGSKYFYFVEATDGENFSKASERVEVPEGTNSVSSVMQAGSYKVSGRLISSENEIEICDLSGRKLFKGCGTFAVNEGGVYILRQGNKAAKLVIK